MKIITKIALCICLLLLLALTQPHYIVIEDTLFHKIFMYVIMFSFGWNLANKIGKFIDWNFNIKDNG